MGPLYYGWLDDRLDALRGAIRARLVTEMGDTRDIKEARATLQSLWEGEFAPLAEMTRDALAGPGAAVSGQDNRQGGSWKDEQAAKHTGGVCFSSLVNRDIVKTGTRARKPSSALFNGLLQIC